MIKKKNLDSSLLSWIMGATGLGPGIGEIFYVASTSSAYYQKLLDDGNVSEGNIFTLPSAAFAAATASRNDIILVTPGAYAETSELAWNKANTHMIGLGSPNVGGDYSEANCAIYTSTAAVNYTVNLTGANCMFRNLVFENLGAATTNLASFYINKYGAFFKYCAFHGAMVSAQVASANCGSLSIGAAGMYPHVEDCIIGQDVWSAMATANAAHLLFMSTGGRPNGGLFKRCQFVSTSITATTSLVRINTTTATGRGWLFRDCTFQNFNDTQTNLNQVFSIVAGAVQKGAVLLHNCSAYGFDEWQDNDTDVVNSTMGVATAGGGLHIEPTATIS